MVLAPGGRRGPFEITAKIGAGGMGEVYRARDTRLDRDVALKVLPEAFATDAERLARFEREAKTLAALNHPHIAHIHGVDESDGIRTLVLEFVDGPTLTERIAQGPLPIADALTIARQIAGALEAAHERGIIHRDLKPANVKVRTDGTVKVLDFGLAKAFTALDSGVEVSASPTISSPAAMTGVGSIVGTAAYMSPEQARGQAIDTRTDVWAFGCVLFEMLTGRRVFPGATISDSIAAVLVQSPDWTALPERTPPAVRHVLARCLDKDPKRRWRNIGDVAIALDDADVWRQQAGEPSPPISRVRERAGWAALVVVALVAAVAAAVARRPAAPSEIRFNLLFPRGVAADFAQLAISPDGQHIVVAPGFGAPVPAPLWLRPLNSTGGQLLLGTEGATFPFWSPDSRSIGFFAEQKVKRYDLTSQAVQILADAPVARGGAWQRDDMILFAPNPVGPLLRVAAAGGQPVNATALAAGQNDHRAPFILPDGSHFLYYARGAPQVRGVHVARLDGTGGKRLLDADGAAVFTRSGHLLFPRQGELLAQSFDVAALALDGEPFRVADSVAVNPGISLASLSASASGPIAYGTESVPRTQFAWFDRSGRRLETLGPPDQRPLANPSLSDNGQRLAFSRVVGGNWDVWVMDIQGAVSRLTSGAPLDFNPIWSPDGVRVFYESNNANIASRSVVDGTAEDLLLREKTMVYPSDVSPDGGVLLYTRADGQSTDLWYIALGADRTPRPFVRTASQERDGEFSPDGRWVAYQSNEAGHFEIYVQPFPGPGERIQVSIGGGQQPRWPRTGSELFYIAADQRLTSVRVSAGANGRLVLGAPVPLFRTEFNGSFLARQQYVVSADGQRFLLNAATDAIDPPSITMILNWKVTP